MNETQESKGFEIGDRIREYREKSGKSAKGFSEELGISPEELIGFEEGDASPSLPMIEIIALHLAVPVQALLDDEPIPEKETPKLDPEKIAIIMELRNKIIGASIRKERLNREKSLEEISESTGISLDDLNSYEIGEKPIPVAQLEQITGNLGIPMHYLQDRNGPVSKWIAQQDAQETFSNLPPVLQEFVGKPINLPYIDLAYKLSELSVSKLRELAEGILEITF